MGWLTLTLWDWWLDMKKSKSTTKTRFKARSKTHQQAKDFVIGELCKMMNACLKEKISDDFACEIVLYLAGNHLLKKGDVEAFQFNIAQLIEHNQELFEKDEIDTDDDGTFH